MRLLVAIAVKHLLARKRQSIVSLLGIVLGVAFFLSISSLMQGSENDFIRRLVDNTPHITIYDEYRSPYLQPVQRLYPEALVELRSVKPLTETRGIRNFEQVIAYLRSQPGIRASQTLVGEALVNFAGKDYGVSLNGMIPEDILGITTIEQYMKYGSVEDLIANPDGIIIGAELARKLTLAYGDNITVTAAGGRVRVFKIVGIFRTGRADYDGRQTYTSLKRVQALLNRPNRANRIIIKLDDPHAAHAVAASVESRIRYKNVSWQEASEDILSTLVIRNVIMYSVVSAVLIVAAFGIYNVISTVVMEKHRDIAILKSMGFHAGDIKRIFVIQGTMLGIIGNVLGIPLGCVLMFALMQVKLMPPGSTEAVQLPLDWGLGQFAIAGGFAMAAAVAAAFLPARKGARVQPVDILRGGT
jgi:lipoprotein-releasing system permease protein